MSREWKKVDVAEGERRESPSWGWGAVWGQRLGAGRNLRRRGELHSEEEGGVWAEAEERRER